MITQSHCPVVERLWRGGREKRYQHKTLKDICFEKETIQYFSCLSGTGEVAGLNLNKKLTV